MRFRTFTITIIAISCIDHYALSQDLVSLPQISPLVPEVANHIRSIEYPVSYAHGSVGINIPLYEIEIDGITIPISISYNHKGLRPFEHTFWLGQGWTLNAEPAISRKVNGKPDIHCKYIPADDNSHPKKQYHLSQVDPQKYLAYLNLYNVNLTNPSQTDYDEYPDEYYYNIPGKSGGFIYKWTQSQGFTPATLPYEPINIEYIPDSKTQNGTFYITDDNGHIFEFGETDCNLLSAYPSPSTWRCNKITTTKGNVTFEYSNGSWERTTSITEIAIVEDEYTAGEFRGNPPLEEYNATEFLGPYIPNMQYRHGGVDRFHFIFGSEYRLYEFRAHSTSLPNLPSVLNQDNMACTRRIKKMSFPNGSIIFSHTNSFSNNTSPTLDEISIYNDSYQLIWRIKFEHANVTTRSFTIGPVLNAIKIYDKDNTLQDSYTFDYYGEFPLFGDYASNNTNFWGYYSGSTNNSAIHTENLQINFMIVGRSLRTDCHFPVGYGSRLDPARTNGILKSITTLPGACTEFEYESDQFIRKRRGGYCIMGDYYNDITNSGGLRIKIIRQYDHSASFKLERHFKYGENESGIGFSRINIDPEEYISTQKVKQYYNDYYEYYQTKRVRTLSAHLHGDVTYSGIPIVYDYVTEYIKGYDINTNQLKDFGKVVYKYDYAHTFADYKYPATYVDFDYVPVPLRGDNKETSWEKGQLLSKQIYKYDENEKTFIPEQHTEFKYASFSKDIIKAGQACIVSTILPANDTSAPEYIAHYNYHYIGTGCKRILSQVDSYFTANGTVTERIDYQYDNPIHLYPTSITTTKSDGSITRQKFSYPGDDVTITEPTHLNAVLKMLEKGMRSPVLELTESSGTAHRTTYNYYQYSELASWPLQYKLVIKDGSSTPEERIVYHRYDRYGNPLYVTKDNVTNVVYLWGYSGQHLVAIIENANYDQVRDVLGTQPETTIINNANHSNIMDKLRGSTLLETAMITSFKYQPMIGIVEITDPRGIKLFYDYDSYGRLTTITDHNGNKLNEYNYHIRNN